MSAGSKQDLLTRRGFMQAAAGVAAAQAMAPALHALVPLHGASRLACRAMQDGIETVRVEGGAWERTGFLTCEAPSALAFHKAGSTLYVAHGTDTFQNLPVGSIGCYRVDLSVGRLSLLHRERLSLACTQPDRLAVSPDGKLLVVASAQAGILNVFPLDEEGIAGAVTAVRRELQWSTLGFRMAKPRLEFVAEHTLAVTDAITQTYTTYQCSQEEISMVDRRLFSAERARNTDAAAIPDALHAQSRAVIWI